MKKIIAKLAVGPMSSECIRAAYQLSSYENIQIMLISSKSQIDYNGGYVNNWTTQQYSTYLDQLRKDYTQSDVVICRDHCGPGFNGDYDLTDTYKTVDADLQANFDFIHVDFCHYKGSHEEKLDQSARLIKYIKQPVHLEVGTDENVGAAEMNLARIEQDIDFFLSFCKPEFYVVQTGSLIKEINQVGTYNVDVVKSISELLHRKGLKLKEHNADYLSIDDLRLRHKVVDAINIAPMLGVLQTSYVLYRSLLYGFDTTSFLNKAYESGKWKKWLYKNTSDNKYLCALTAGHYVFTSDEYRSLVDKLDKVEDIHEDIIEQHYIIMENYLVGLEETNEC